MRQGSIAGVLFRAAAVVSVIAAIVFGGGAHAASAAIGASASAPAGSTLRAFASEEEFQRYIKHRIAIAQATPLPPPAPPEAAMTESAAAPAPMQADSVSAGRAATTPSITNNQEANVDEGDIVKIRGDILVILRRGRLFTVSLAGGHMRAVDSINAYPPGVDASADWYDEMLVSGDHVVVIGYSYGRGGTEIDRFRLSGDGHLRFDDAYQLRSNDYYSSRNYASRLIGNRLILYSPLYMAPWDRDPLVAFPALRKWTGNPNGEFHRIVSAQQIYFSPRLQDQQIQAVHTVTSCDVAAPELHCDAVSVLGPAGRTFYVSARAVYVWTTAFWWGGDGGHPTPSILYRLPLDGSAPSATGVVGAPVDQFAFREDYDDGIVNVLVRAESDGDAMWAPEHTHGAVALLRLPFRAFNDGTRDAAMAHYRPLPRPSHEGYDFHERFVGDYVLYGNGNGWGAPQETYGTLIVAPVHDGEPVKLSLPHGVDRIEAMGNDAVVVGSDRSNVYFSAIELGRRTPVVGDTYTLADAAQAETRSHGFFFKPEGEDSSGVLGLPVARAAAPAFQQLFTTSAAMVFLRRADGKFAPLGTLDSHPATASDDACVASCVDWYGNARPIFLGNRTFALMGYELVEGRVSRRTITEEARLNFAPPPRHGRERETQ